MRKAIATVSLSGTLPQKLEAAAAAKFDAIELFAPDLIACPMSPAEVAQRCTDLGLEIALYQPIRDVEGVPQDSFAGVVRRVEAAFEVMEELEVTTALVCSNVDPAAIADPDLSAAQLDRLAQRAAEHGIQLGFEALAWGRHLNRLTEAWDVVQRVDRPNLGLVVDTFHLLARGDDAHALDGIPGERITFMQIADAPHLVTDVLQWSRHHRCFPGQGTFDLASVVGQVIEQGYRGPLSLEVFSDIVREADAHATALDAMRSLLHLEEQLRLRWSTEAQRPRVTLFDPPPAQPSRIGFAEIAVQDPQDLAPLLAGLGFAQTGTHRSKAVTRWTAGGADIVLNASSDLQDRWSRAVHRPAVTGFGIEVDDVETYAERAGALLWPRLPLRRGVNEVEMRGTDSPAGVHVFVAGAAGSPDDWRQDFDPNSSADTHDSTVTGIDHLGYPIGFDVSDAEISFYRTLHDLPAGEITEFANTQGRLRSRVLRSPSGDSPQVVLNVLAGATKGRQTGINQIALAVGDVFAAADAASRAGVGMLQVPRNYYLDLAARFEIDRALLARLQQHHVMYDRDDSGEVLHCYTRLVGGAFYVELIQRLDGYSGFGANNTAVRLVTQATQAEDARPVQDAYAASRSAAVR